MSRRPGPDVRVWDLRDQGRKIPWIVRWVVSGQKHSKAFARKIQADQFRSQLISAKSDSMRFDPPTGLPIDWAPGTHTVATWTKWWFDSRKDAWAPRSRKSNYEAIVRALPHLARPRAPKPPDDFGIQAYEWLMGDEGYPTP